MNNEIELESIIEDYLNGKLSAEEARAFEQLRQNDPNIDHRVVSHKVLESIREYAGVLALKDTMDNAHDHINVAALSKEFKPSTSFMMGLWRNNKSAIAIAASFLLLTFVSIYSIQHNTKQNGSYELMRRELAKIRNDQNNLIRNIKSNNNNLQKQPVNPAKWGGTGFALTSNGYLCTNNHVIEGADSVYVQNNKGESFKVKVVFRDSQYDIAILKITDDAFSPLGNLPYKLKKNNIGMGENVYTLGFPKDDAVLGVGYVSSKTGLAGDTTQYQVSIPVNPGNSGGPLLDNHGNVIGVIKAKENQVDGATFAVKSKYVLEALNAIPQDSLGKMVLNRKNPLQGLTRTRQIEKIQDYVFMIKVYN